MHFLENEIAPDADLKVVSNLASEQTRLEKQVESAEEALKALKNRLQVVRTKLLPAALEAVGLSAVTLQDGSTIRSEPKVYAAISDRNIPAAVEWLESRGEASILKTSLTVDFPRAKDAKQAEAVRLAMQELESTLGERGLGYTKKQGVHPSTLKAFVKEQLSAGVDIPRAIFGIYEETETIIERK